MDLQLGSQRVHCYAVSIFLVGKAQTFAVGSIPTSCIEGLDLIVQSGCHLLFTERAVTNATRLRFEDRAPNAGAWSGVCVSVALHRAAGILRGAGTRALLVREH